ncbi:MAG: DUF3302 domain-containing protein [Betaproteobacteria bacterium]|nr:DUF3302 domain-containing protein [Betaproteobacteria bacterium]
MPCMSRWLLAVLLVAAAAPARASFLSGAAIDKAADILAIGVLIIVPVTAIVVFWLVHILPEKFAHKRHHPQRDAIQVLCLLSLVFGGLLWPIAWLWAFTRPVAYRAAYGTDKHEEYFDEMAESYRAGKLAQAEILQLREELREIEGRGALTPRLRELKEELLRLRISEAKEVEASPAQQAEGKAA